MEYKVVYGIGHLQYDAAIKLNKEVETLINEGWKPLGGVSVVYNDATENYTYSQAMIRE